MVALVVRGLLPWLLGAALCRRSWSLIPMATALLVYRQVQLGVDFCSTELARGSSAFKVLLALGRVERWQSPVDCARLEIV